MGPYGITPVDVPGILSAYSGARQQRMQQMALQRQWEREDREAERENRTRIALSKVFSPQTKGGDPASGGVAPAASIGGAAPAPQAPTTLVDPSQLPPRTDGLTINQDALRELYRDDPGTAMKIQDMVYNADKRQFEMMQRNGGIMANVAFRLKQLPPEERAAELRAWAPQLLGLGLTPEQLNGADLSDNGLQRYLVVGQNLEKLIDQEQPKLRSLSPGEVVFDERTGREVMRSPLPRIVMGPDGQQYVVDAPAPSAPAPSTSRSSASPIANAAAVAESIYPGIKITDNRRDPNSPLGRANPNSWHNRSGGAIDARPIPGMTFEQYVQGYRDKGYDIIEARDEVSNPSAHATGRHWHVVLGQKRGGANLPSPKNRQEYEKLAPGTEYITPNGKHMRKS